MLRYTLTGLRARLGAAGRERVLANFTWARAAQGTVARYREAIAARGPATGTRRPAPETPGRPAAPSVAAVSTASPSDTSVYPESRATC
ncbi:hypothetical protein ABZ785_31845 [Streptomyces incarnatus]